MTRAIETLDLTKRYSGGRITALNGVSIAVNEGELFGLIGPDGAGKTSLYRILATLSTPDSGTASLLGLDCAKDWRQLRTRIGYMPERFSLYPDLTVMENLRFFASLFGVSVRDNYSFIAPVFGQLERFPDRMARKLSGGMKQKLALSCALIHRPSVLLLDEPTTGVDAVSRSEFWNMLATLRKNGITVMVSTSYMDEATRCDRIAMIDHGRILRTDTPAGLVASLGETLYAASATDMFALLEKLRSFPEVERCYTFGATLHIVARKDFNPYEVCCRLAAAGMEQVTVEPVRGDIEDLFIKLTADGNG